MTSSQLLTANFDENLCPFLFIDFCSDYSLLSAYISRPPHAGVYEDKSGRLRSIMQSDMVGAIEE